MADKLENHSETQNTNFLKYSDEAFSNSDKPSLKMNERIMVGGSVGVVKYIGRVGNTSGLWVGVDWDDGKRGKHDGSHEGVRLELLVL